jgi:hypothetical protein
LDFYFLKVIQEMHKQVRHAIFKWLSCLILNLCFLQIANAATCDFAPVKAAIDTLLDDKLQSGQEYRKKVHEGWDSVKVLSDMSSLEMRQAIDVCRFEVIEYLTKKGFAPSH